MSLSSKGYENSRFCLAGNDRESFSKRGKNKYNEIRTNMSETRKRKRIICIGAGASGLFFGLNCADQDHEVILLDSNPKAGRKMYISGKGRCNITNDCDVKEFIGNVVRNPKFLYSAIHRFGPADTIAFFNEHGCPLKTERGNRVFPVSDHAADIIDCLVKECRKKGVKLCFEQKVTDIRKEADQFLIKTKDHIYKADKLVIATGGKSYPSTGSRGDGYQFAEQFKHHIVELKSALCPIRVKEEIKKEMLKLTLKNVSLTARNERFHKTIFGDLEFLPGAITGPIVLSMSSLINREGPVELFLDLKPALEEEKLDKRLLREIDSQPNKDVSYLLSTLLPKEFVAFFVECSSIDPDLVLNTFTRKKRHELISYLKRFPFHFDGLEEIDKGIITSGGVDVNEIDPKTMESKLCRDLYFIGEVLDVDAMTGGFNMQIALSTGYSCATAIVSDKE